MDDIERAVKKERDAMRAERSAMQQDYTDLQTCLGEYNTAHQASHDCGDSFLLQFVFPCHPARWVSTTVIAAHTSALFSMHKGTKSL